MDEGLIDVKGNVFENIPESFPQEIFETIHETPALLIERILSAGQATPAGEWLVQERNEWVLLLRGKAGVKFEDTDDIIELNPGDHLFISAFRKHRVEWTAGQEATVWLAVHF